MDKKDNRRRSCFLGELEKEKKVEKRLEDFFQRYQETKEIAREAVKELRV